MSAEYSPAGSLLPGREPSAEPSAYTAAAVPETAWVVITQSAKTFQRRPVPGYKFKTEHVRGVEIERLLALMIISSAREDGEVLPEPHYRFRGDFIKLSPNVTDLDLLDIIHTVEATVAERIQPHLFVTDSLLRVIEPVTFPEPQPSYLQIVSNSN